MDGRACVMLDALLLGAGPIFLPDCLIPEPTNCPYLTSVLPRCSGTVERSWWLTLDFGGAIVHSIPHQGIRAAQLGICPLANLISPFLRQAESVWSLPPSGS